MEAARAGAAISDRAIGGAPAAPEFRQPPKAFGRVGPYRYSSCPVSLRLCGFIEEAQGHRGTETVLNNFELIEEIADLESSGLGPIGPVEGISLDVRAELFADRSIVGFRRIRCAHYLAEFLDGIVRFEHHRHDRPFSHETHETAEERSLFVDIIKALGLSLAEVKHFRCADSK